MSGWWWPRRTMREAREDDGYKAMFGDVKKKKEIPFDFGEDPAAAAAGGAVEPTADGDDLDLGFTKGYEEGGPVDTSRLDGIDEAGLTEDLFAMADAPSGVDIGLELWLGSDHDYSSQDLLSRSYSRLHAANPVLASLPRNRFMVAPPQLFREGMKKSIFANIAKICKNMHRQDEDIIQFLLSKMGTAESVNGAGYLVIKHQFQQKQIENVVSYICPSQFQSNTSLARLANHPTPPHKGKPYLFVACESCGSRRCRSVNTIKSGFQAQVAKRSKNKVEVSDTWLSSDIHIRNKSYQRISSRELTL
ncbi:translation initiation factor [Coprinopsis sp. MPI-PUGE-AT-0042]|nr:translation initiation factor [Coprinopsis sp. MPI-PUGE-AT-0042]